MYSNTLVHLECFKNLKRGFFVKQYGYCSQSEQVNSYKMLALVMSLFVCCMSGEPRVFDGKTCAHDELIHVVRHVWLTVN